MFITFIKSSKNFIISFIEDNYKAAIQDWLEENIDQNYYVTENNKVFDFSEIEKIYKSDNRFIDEDGRFNIYKFEHINGFDNIEVEPVGHIQIYDTDHLIINGEVEGML